MNLSPQHLPAQRIVILDFGSQYTQVIARRIRECGVYSEILSYKTKASELRRKMPSGLILSGGPDSVYAKGAPKPDAKIFELGIPVLGICYGLQLMAQMLGGRVAKGARREYGRGVLKIERPSPLFEDLPSEMTVWNSHGDRIEKLPSGFRTVAISDNAPHAAVEHSGKAFFGLQFHPEVAHTPKGQKLLSNFVHVICGCDDSWTMASFIESSCEAVREQVGNGRVILGLSGGVDSSVAAILLHKAIGDQLTCVFVNNGLLRKNEADAVQKLFGAHFRMKLKYVNASPSFLRLLRGVSDPERKRKIIGKEFIKVFQQACGKLGRPAPSFLAQGTLYPDVIESIAINDNPAAVIKSHHNVGGLPKTMKLKLVEPLRHLFKDEVRLVGEQLGLPKEVVWRQPFPGPGLAVRCLGPITPQKLELLREADAIVLEEMKQAGWYYKVWQSFAVLLPCKSVGVMGDERSYEFTAAVRVVESQDGMTADWVHLPYEILEKISSRIINEVRGINRVVFDITSKPPGTIEWE